MVPNDLLAAGADAANVGRLQNDVTAFQKARRTTRHESSSIPAAHYAAVNASLLKIQKQISKALTGLSPFQSTIYPHEQVLLDVQSLNYGDRRPEAGVCPDTTAAQEALVNVDWNSNGLSLDHDVYAHLLGRLNPSYKYVAWGAQGHPVWPLQDVMPQYNAIGNGTWNAETVSQLTAMRDQDLADAQLEAR